MSDWKEKLKGLKEETPNFRKKQVIRKTKYNFLINLTKDFMVVHPRNMLMKLSPYFNTITHNRGGSWPSQEQPEVEAEFVLENIGDLPKVLLVKDGNIFYKTEKGLFRFFNKKEID